MTSKQSARGLVIVLAGALCFSGYVLTSTRADLEGTNSYIAISTDVIIRQGNGVNYSFAYATTISKLEIKNASIEIDDWLEIGATCSNGYLSNVLYDLGPSHISWSSNSSEPSATATYTVGGLSPWKQYDVYVDSYIVAKIVTGAPGTVNFQWNVWSNHTFDIYMSTTYSPEEEPSIPEDHSPPTTAPGGTYFSWTSLSMIAIFSLSILVIILLLLRRSHRRSGRQHT